MPGTRKLGRATSHRDATLRNLTTQLLEFGKIETTLAKAKEVRCMAEKMITLGKTNTLHTRRQALGYITKEEAMLYIYLGDGDITKKEFDFWLEKLNGENKLGNPKYITPVPFVIILFTSPGISSAKRRRYRTAAL